MGRVDPHPLDNIIEFHGLSPNPIDLDLTWHEHAFVRGFGGCAATHLKGTEPVAPFLAILTSTPWVVVTVPALVLCARL